MVVDATEFRVERSGMEDMVRKSRVVFTDNLADLLLERMRLVVLDDCGVGDTPVGVSVQTRPEHGVQRGLSDPRGEEDERGVWVVLRGEVELAMRRSDLDDGSLVELVQGIAHSGAG